MNKAFETLTSLQARQRKHDTRAHQDIFYLPYPERIKHLTFHVAKYAGRLATPGSSQATIRQTLVDAFIIALSAADVLKINLAEALQKRAGTERCNDLSQLGRLLLKTHEEPAEPLLWYLRMLAVIGGRMAKACESLDHMEPVPYRIMLTEGVIDLCVCTIEAGCLLDVNLKEAVHQRWSKIEAESIL
jgi:hypothetical protein